ncbi:MAG TPA: MBL fold metallo-hydrolase [Thermoanaerobaculia bacterium]
MRLVPLGTNGYYPSHGRQTMSYLVLPDGGGALLLDAGTGVARLGEAPIQALLQGAEILDLLLTHYHLDHVVGLSILPAVLDSLPVRIHAPGKPMVDADPAEALCRLIHPPLFPIPLTEFPMPVELERLTGESATIAGLEVRLRRQEHPGGSLGVRLGDSLAYVTDTVADDATVGFAAGVDLLLHEVWADAGDEAVGGHSAVDEVARIAVRAGVRRLMPVHHHPRRTWADLQTLAAELARRAQGVEVVLPEEGRVYEVGAGRPAQSP